MSRLCNRRYCDLDPDKEFELQDFFPCFCLFKDVANFFVSFDRASRLSGSDYFVPTPKINNWSKNLGNT